MTRHCELARPDMTDECGQPGYAILRDLCGQPTVCKSHFEELASSFPKWIERAEFLTNDMTVSIDVPIDPDHKACVYVVKITTNHWKSSAVVGIFTSQEMASDACQDIWRLVDAGDLTDDFECSYSRVPLNEVPPFYRLPKIEDFGPDFTDWADE